MSIAALLRDIGLPNPTENQMRDLNNVAERAGKDFAQRQNNASDYPECSPEWYLYALVYSQLLTAAKAEGAA